MSRFVLIIGGKTHKRKLLHGLSNRLYIYYNKITWKWAQEGIALIFAAKHCPNGVFYFYAHLFFMRYSTNHKKREKCHNISTLYTHTNTKKYCRKRRRFRMDSFFFLFFSFFLLVMLLHFSILFKRHNIHDILMYFRLLSQRNNETSMYILECTYTGVTYAHYLMHKKEWCYCKEKIKKNTFLPVDFICMHIYI